jgi:outer membrane protein insertion porin family
MAQCNLLSKSVNVLLFALLVIFFPFSNVLAQQDKLVENVEILGNRRLSDEGILRHIETRAGDRFDEKQVQKDLQTLFELGFFNASNTKVTTEIGVRGGINVNFLVFEQPFISEINFEGLKFVTKEEILAELRNQQAEIVVDTPYKYEKILKAQHVITKYFSKKRGFDDARVFVSEEAITDSTVKITFEIDEMQNDDKTDYREP